MITYVMDFDLFFIMNDLKHISDVASTWLGQLGGWDGDGQGSSCTVFTLAATSTYEHRKTERR